MARGLAHVKYRYVLIINCIFVIARLLFLIQMEATRKGLMVGTSH